MKLHIIPMYYFDWKIGTVGLWADFCSHSSTLQERRGGLYNIKRDTCVFLCSFSALSGWAAFLVPMAGLHELLGFWLFPRFDLVS